MRQRHEAASRGSVGIAPLLRSSRFMLGSKFPRLFALVALSLFSALLEVAVLSLVALLGMAIVRGSPIVSLPVPIFGEAVLGVNEAIRFAAVILVALFILALPVARMAASLSRIAQTRMRSRLVATYLGSQWASRSRDPEGHIQSLIAEYCSRSELLIQHVATLAVALSSLVIIGIATVVIAPLAAAVALVGLVVVTLIIRPLNRRVKRDSRNNARADKELASRVAEMSRVSAEVAAFSVVGEVLKRLNAQIADAGRKIERVRVMTRLIPVLYQYGALALVLTVVAVLTTVNPAGLLAAGPVILILVRALGYSKQVQSAIQAGNALLPYPATIEAEVARLSENELGERHQRILEFERLNFEDVSFAYPDNPAVLQNVTLKIHTGEAVGVVGSSGAGKSTFVQLLLRLQVPTSGSIRLNDIPSQYIDDYSWARLIAYVPQDNKLIYGTVTENILFFRKGYEADDIATAAKAAHLHNEIVQFPLGYDTIIGAGGADLSGGQRQRLGIARAMLGNPSILVLDEPTSALDSKSEQLLKTTLEELRGNQTLILVAHRPSTIEICERILLFEGGRVTVASSKAEIAGAEVLVKGPDG